jgi:hypothetical protein
MAFIHDIVVDCAHPAPLARFWAAVLDGYDVAPYDQAELDRLRANGIDDPEDDPTVLVEAGPGRPRFFFVLVPDGKRDEPRTGDADMPRPGRGALDHLPTCRRAGIRPGEGPGPVGRSSPRDRSLAIGGG